MKICGSPPADRFYFAAIVTAARIPIRDTQPEQAWTTNVQKVDFDFNRCKCLCVIALQRCGKIFCAFCAQL